MIITDLEILEIVEQGNNVVGAFTVPIDFDSDIEFDFDLRSSVSLTPFSSTATGEADAFAAPFFVEGSSYAQSSTVLGAGLASGIPGVQVGSSSRSTGVAATIF